MLVNFDNDVDGNRIGIVDENWYFIPLTGNSTCPIALFGTGRAKLVIDDDKYIDVNRDDGWGGMDVNDEFDLNVENPGAASVGASSYAGHNDLNEILVSGAAAFPICLYGSNMCSGGGLGYNAGAQYDLNTSADNNVQDGNLLIYNLFDYSDQFYEPSNVGSSVGIREYLRLEVRDFDYNYVTSPVSASGSVVNEQTGVTVVKSFSGTVPDGQGRRILMDGNFAPTGTNGTGFMVSVDVNYLSDVRPTFGFMWSVEP